jgi:hypothetical protein
MRAKHQRDLRTWPVLAALIATEAAFAQPTPLPQGLSWIARDPDTKAWHLQRVGERGKVVPVPTQVEPRQACLQPDGRAGVYTAADGTLRRLSPDGETVLARANAQRAYTQPCMSVGSGDVVVVEMADGKSVETEIVRFSSTRPAPELIARQAGAQHEPFLHRDRWLVYSSVHCSDGCERLIVEIWRRDLVSGDARQLTLLNALSQGPVTDGQRVLFSSNVTGSFQIWEVGLEGQALRPLTRVEGQATQPTLCGGRIFFVWSVPNGSTLAELVEGDRVSEVSPQVKGAPRALRCLP